MHAEHEKKSYFEIKGLTFFLKLQLNSTKGGFDFIYIPENCMFIPSFVRTIEPQGWISFYVHQKP